MLIEGDYPKTIIKKGDFNYANEMVEFIKENYLDLNIIVAAYSDNHPHSNYISKDIDFFVNKVNAGADEAVTKYFYNIDTYLHFYK